MNKKIVSIMLVLSMIMSYSTSVFAEGLEDYSSSVESNISETSDIIGSTETEVSNNDLSSNNNIILEDNSKGDDNDDNDSNGIVSSSVNRDIDDVGGSYISSTNQTLSFDLDSEKEELNSNKDAVYSTDSDTDIIFDISSLEEDENIDLSFGVDSEEEMDDSFGVDFEEGIDDSFGVDFEEDIDDSFGIDSEEDTELDTGDTVIDNSQDQSGYIVYETPEGAYDGLDLDAPTAVGEDPKEEVDAGYTISAQEELKGYENHREPLIFKSYDGMTLYRTQNGAIAANDYVSINSTGVDVCLIGVEVVPVNGWSMVGREVDFKNIKADTREFRLTVDNQVIVDRDGDGYIAMRDPVVYGAGEVICIPMELELGPFTKGLSEGLFSFVLVFEEVISEEELIVESMQNATKEEQVETEKAEQETTEEENETLAETEKEVKDETSVETEEVVETETPVEKEEQVENETSTENEEVIESEDSTENEIIDEVVEDTLNEEGVLDLEDEQVSEEITDIIEEPQETPDLDIIEDNNAFIEEDLDIDTSNDEIVSEVLESYIEEDEPAITEPEPTQDDLDNGDESEGSESGEDIGSPMVLEE